MINLALTQYSDFNNFYLLKTSTVKVFNTSDKKHFENRYLFPEAEMLNYGLTCFCVLQYMLKPLSFLNSVIHDSSIGYYSDDFENLGGKSFAVEVVEGNSDKRVKLGKNPNCICF